MHFNLDRLAFTSNKWENFTFENPSPRRVPCHCTQITSIKFRTFVNQLIRQKESAGAEQAHGRRNEKTSKQSVSVYYDFFLVRSSLFDFTCHSIIIILPLVIHFAHSVVLEYPDLLFQSIFSSSPNQMWSFRWLSNEMALCRANASIRIRQMASLYRLESDAGNIDSGEGRCARARRKLSHFIECLLFAPNIHSYFSMCFCRY